MTLLAEKTEMRDGARRLSIHTRDFILDHTGLTKFFDPVPREALEAFRAALLPRTATFGRALQRSADRDLVGCCTGQFAIFVMQCYRAAQLVQRCRAANIDVDASDSDFLSRFLRSDFTAVEQATRRILTGRPGRPAWRTPARMIRNAFIRSPIVRHEIRPVDLQNEIVTIAVSSHLEKHAAAVDDTVCYVHPSVWYGPIETYQGTELTPVRDGLVEVARQAYAAVGAAFDACSERIISRWADSVPAAVYARLLDLKSRKLPRRLWIGSAGPLWSRMLGHAVRADGGHVTGHDHWTSVGFFRANVKAINDYECVDEFLALTDAQAKGLERTCRHDILVRRDKPRFGVIPGNPWLSNRNIAGNAAPATGNKVMLVINHFNGSGVAMYPDDSDYVLVDWHARLITHLQSNGYEVILKPHPQCLYGVPDGLRSLVGGRVLLEPFGEVCGQADVLIYDFPMSTTFAEGLEGSQPIVVVEFQQDLYEPGALDMLQRRCAVVQGWKDESGRRQVDWDALPAAVESTRHLSDPIFFKTYLTY